jgi:hypothetical protein
MDTIALKKIGGSLYFKLPLSYRHRFTFSPGDLFHLIPNADGSVLKLIRTDDVQDAENQLPQNVADAQEASVAAE